MSIFDDYTLENYTPTSHNNYFKTEIINLKHNQYFTDEFNLSEVYNFCKKDIKNFINFYKSVSTFSNYSLFVSYEQEKQNVYHISIDYMGAILKKEKYFLFEDITLQFSFNINIIIELYNFPLLNIYPKNTLEVCLSPTFELCNEERRESGSVQIKTIKFKSKTIETGIYSTEEIYNKTLQHIINLQCLYKQDRIDDLIATKTTYTLKLNSNVLYHVEINTKGETLYESKQFHTLTTVSSPFKLFIFISIHHDPGEVSRQIWLEE